MKKLLLFTVFVSVCTFVILSCKKNKNSSGSCATVCKATLGSGETAATNPAAIQKAFTFTFKYGTGAGPFKDGDKATFTPTADNKLVVSSGGKCVTIENPYSKTGSIEIYYRDKCVFNTTFAVVVYNNTVHEINLQDPNGTTFWGQFQ